MNVHLSSIMSKFKFLASQMLHGYLYVQQETYLILVLHI